MTLSKIVIEMLTMTSSTVAAFWLLGRWKAGTPLATPCTPVRATVPEAKERNNNTPKPSAVKVSNPSAGRNSNCELAARPRDPVNH